MKLSPALQHTLKETAWRKHTRLVEITQQLIQTPSENTPPHGSELSCQNWLAGELQKLELKTDLYLLQDVAGLQGHPLFQAGRNYSNRPNLAARREGTEKGGRSLLLSGHIDTVPRGSTQNWTRDPFSAHVADGRIYGRGANDMKGGVATNLFVMECLAELDLVLRGDLIFESVVDEEFGGSNGTLAGRVRGYNADAAVLSEPSSLRICPAQRGGRTAHLTFRASGGVLQDGKFPAGIIPQLTHFLNRLPDFAEQRRKECRPHVLYANSPDPIPVSVTKVFTAPWGFGEPITTPEAVHLELYWQLMPGEEQEEVEREFFAWLRALVEGDPSVYPAAPEVNFPIRWLPGSAIPGDHPVVRELTSCVESVTGEKPAVAGIEGPCDLFVFQQGFNIPAVIWGARGGNTHAADEYVEINSLVTAATALLLFVAEWCGVAHA